MPGPATQPAAPPIDLIDYWENRFLLGPYDNFQDYFDKWFGELDPLFDTIRGIDGALDIAVLRQHNFNETGYEYRFRDNSSVRAGAQLSYLVISDNDGTEQIWTVLEGFKDLEEAWRFDLIESFNGEPSYIMLKDILIRYWQGEHTPRLLMQIDPATKKFFFVPREEKA